MKWFVAAILASVVTCACCMSADVEENHQTSTETPSYECRHIANDVITVDGKLTEPCWQAAPIMQFRKLHEGSKPPLETFTRLVWDDKYIYVGFDVREPNVWARAALRDDECSEDYARRAFLHDQIRSKEWSRLECNVMYFDTFVKVFLDPDMDGTQYVEFQINPINSIFDAWYDQGFIEKWGDQERGPHVSWNCPGLITAVSVEGTLNAPHDVDKGWCLEMAIPWKALEPFAEGACPPRAGDVWTALLGRTQKDRFTAKDANWTWPAVGDVSSHKPHTYGRLVFTDKPSASVRPEMEGDAQAAQ